MSLIRFFATFGSVAPEFWWTMVIKPLINNYSSAGSLVDKLVAAHLPEEVGLVEQHEMDCRCGVVLVVHSVI